VEPIAPALTLAVLVTLKSTLTTLVIVDVLVLLLVSGSAVVLVMPTALVMEPVSAVGITVSVMTPLPRAARLAIVSVTPAVVVLRVPELATAVTRVNPAALSESVSVTFAAALGPEFPYAMT